MWVKIGVTKYILLHVGILDLMDFLMVNCLQGMSEPVKTVHLHLSIKNSYMKGLTLFEIFAIAAYCATIGNFIINLLKYRDNNKD